MACHCGLFDRHKIATRKLISRIKKSDSADVVQRKILHICDGLFFTYALNRDDNYSFLKKTTAYFQNATFVFPLFSGAFDSSQRKLFEKVILALVSNSHLRLVEEVKVRD